MTACLLSVAPMSRSAGERVYSRAVSNGDMPGRARQMLQGLPILMPEKPTVCILPYEGMVGPSASVKRDRTRGSPSARCHSPPR